VTSGARRILQPLIVLIVVSIPAVLVAVPEWRALRLERIASRQRMASGPEPLARANARELCEHIKGELAPFLVRMADAGTPTHATRGACAAIGPPCSSGSPRRPARASSP